MIYFHDFYIKGSGKSLFIFAQSFTVGAVGAIVRLKIVPTGERPFQRGSQFMKIVTRVVSYDSSSRSLAIHNSSLMYLGFNCSIRLMKSPFSKQPSQISSQSLRIFLRSLTLSFLRSTVFKSICFSYRSSQICLSFFFSFSQTLAAGIPQEKGLDISPRIPVAASAVPPK